MTQEQLAGLLGVRRESVTVEAQKLQKAGCVHYSRGHIVVLDRFRLEQHACECYAVVEREHERLLPTAPIARADAALGHLARRARADSPCTLSV
jgi:hypothetical protein